MSRDFFTAAERAALDRATAPALPAGFADSLVDTAMARPAVVPPRRPIGLNWRSWRRHSRILFGFGALALAGATAAATGGGLFEHLPSSLPQLAAAVGFAPASPAPKQVTRAHKPRPAVPTPPPEPDEVATVLPSPPTDGQIAAHRARVAAYRSAVLAGEIAPLPPRARRLIAMRVQERIATLPPERRAELQARIEAMTPEQRAQAYVALEARFLANHPLLAERLRERAAMAQRDATLSADAGTGDPASENGADFANSAPVIQE